MLSETVKKKKFLPTRSLMLFMLSDWRKRSSTWALDEEETRNGWGQWVIAGSVSTHKTVFQDLLYVIEHGV